MPDAGAEGVGSVEECIRTPVWSPHLLSWCLYFAFVYTQRRKYSNGRMVRQRKDSGRNLALILCPDCFFSSELLQRGETNRAVDSFATTRKLHGLDA